jgi:hypothetical protein
MELNIPKQVIGLGIILCSSCQDRDRHSHKEIQASLELSQVGIHPQAFGELWHIKMVNFYKKE